MKKLSLFIVLMCVLSSLPHAQLQLNASMDGERFSELPGLEMPTNISNSALDNPAKSSEYDVYGIIIQGAFLLLFDGINLLLIPKT